MIPLIHDFDGETVLVVGGGRVGARKARRFTREATVVVVSPAFADADFGEAERVRAKLDPDGVEGWLDRMEPALVVAATDDVELNATLERVARDRGLLVNRADERGARDAGSVVVPATVREDPVVVAVSTGGHSPALSRYLREQIEPELAGAGTMAELTAEIRTELEAAGYDAAARRKILRTVVSSREVWTGLDTVGSNVRQRAVDVIERITGETT